MPSACMYHMDMVVKFRCWLIHRQWLDWVRVYRTVPLYFCLLALATGTCYNNHDEAPFKRSRQYRQRGGSSEAPSRANLGSDLDTVL